MQLLLLCFDAGVIDGVRLSGAVNDCDPLRPPAERSPARPRVIKTALGSFPSLFFD